MTKISLTKTGIDVDKTINMGIHNTLKILAPDYPDLVNEVKLDAKFIPWDGALLVAAVRAKLNPHVVIAKFGSDRLMSELHDTIYTHAAAQLKIPNHTVMRIATKTKLPDAMLSLGVGIKLIELLGDEVVIEVQDLLRSVGVKINDFYKNYVDLME